jgi:hypothetical protein
MRRLTIALLPLLVALVALSGQRAGLAQVRSIPSTDTPTPTDTPTVTLTPTATPTPTITPTPLIPTATPVPTVTPMPTLTATSAPLPTATPVASPGAPTPSGPDLIRRLQQALATKGSAHLDISSTTEDAEKDTTVVTTTADISSRAHRSHLSTRRTSTYHTGRSTSTSHSSDESMWVGKVEAVRTGSLGWQCLTYRTVPPSTYDLSMVPGKLQKATNLGADSLSGAPVWHVQAQWSDGGLAQTWTIDYFIDQASRLPVRVNIAISHKLVGSTALTTMHVDYSRYGESVKVQLPAACR